MAHQRDEAWDFPALDIPDKTRCMRSIPGIERFAILRAKLPQMMTQMLVHQCRPLVRRQPPEEAMGMRGVAPRTGGRKPID